MAKFAALTETDHELLGDGLRLLLAQKHTALTTVNQEPKESPHAVAFTAHDFGIPQIQALLERVDSRTLSPLLA